ncbi:hypothetical protein LEP3755_62470 [Leptolyngbya sp. NIES-3755]|nr:hypothetical protein LEP3755_62470 [Leptolyngbya sp. NIES-3755]
MEKMLLEALSAPFILQAKTLIACTFDPNPLQWIAIIGLVTASSVVAMASGVGVIAIAQTVIALIATGASIDTAVGALAAQLGMLTGSSELLFSLVTAIYNVLGCHPEG